MPTVDCFAQHLIFKYFLSDDKSSTGGEMAQIYVVCCALGEHSKWSEYFACWFRTNSYDGRKKSDGSWSEKIGRNTYKQWTSERNQRRDNKQCACWQQNWSLHNTFSLNEQNKDAREHSGDQPCGGSYHGATGLGWAFHPGRDFCLEEAETCCTSIVQETIVVLVRKFNILNFLASAEKSFPCGKTWRWNHGW